MTAVLALCASMLWGTSDFYGGTLSRRMRPAVVILVSQALGLAGVAVVAAAAGLLASPGPYLVWGVACGLVGPLALAAFYRALATSSMGVVAPVASLGVGVPVVVGVLAGEHLAPVQVAGMAVAVVGVVLAAGAQLHRRSPDGLGPIGLALAAALGFGVVFALLARGATTSVAMTLMAQRATSVAALGAGLALSARKLGAGASRPHGGASRADRGAPPPECRRPWWLRPFGRHQPGVASSDRLQVRAGDLPGLALVGFADVAANAAYGWATLGGLVAVVAVLASLYPVVTALLARQVHGERLGAGQLVGVAVAVGGAALLAAG